MGRKPKSNRDHHGRPRTVQTRQDLAVKRFEKSINMEALRLFLDAGDVPRYQVLFGLMIDPAYRRFSFASLLKKSQITLQEIQQLYTDGMRHIGLLQMMNQLPAIMADVADDAKNTLGPCPRCDAVGIVPFGENGTRVCPVCDGAKQVKKIGDKHARDLVFESAKLIHQSGPMVGIQTNIHLGDANLETMLKRTRSIVLDKPPAPAVASPDAIDV